MAPGASETSGLHLGQLLVPVGAVAPHPAELVVRVLVLVRPIVPLPGEHIALEAPLVALLPRTSLEAQFLPLLVAEVVAAHAAVDETAVVRLQRAGDGSLVVRRRPTTALVGIAVVEQQLLHLEQLPPGHRHGRVDDAPLQEFRARRLGQRPLVAEEVDGLQYMVRVPRIEVFVSALRGLLRPPQMPLELFFLLRRFVQNCRLRLPFLSAGGDVIAASQDPIVDGLHPPFVALHGLTFGLVYVPFDLESVQHDLQRWVVPVVRIEIYEDRDGRRATLGLAILDKIDLILRHVLFAVYREMGRAETNKPVSVYIKQNLMKEISYNTIKWFDSINFRQLTPPYSARWGS